MGDVMYRLTEGDGRVLGVFDTPGEAKRLVPEVDRWWPVDGGAEGDLDGWPPNYRFGEKPRFKIRVCQ